MTKQDLYRELCIEAGTFDGKSSADEWYDACAHNITPDLDNILTSAANGDVAALAEARQECGLPVVA